MEWEANPAALILFIAFDFQHTNKSPERKTTQ